MYTLFWKKMFSLRCNLFKFCDRLKLNNILILDQSLFWRELVFARNGSRASASRDPCALHFLPYVDPISDLNASGAPHFSGETASPKSKSDRDARIRGSDLSALEHKMQRAPKPIRWDRRNLSQPLISPIWEKCSHALICINFVLKILFTLTSSYSHFHPDDGLCGAYCYF